MLQIKNTLGGGKPEGLYAWYKYAKSKTPTIIREALEKAPYYFVDGEMLVYHDEIHILGGNSNTKNTHYKYDGSSWTLISTLPGNVSYYKSNTDKFFVYNDKICAINSSENILHEWDEENGWVSKGYCAEATHVLTTQCVYNGKVYFLGSGTSSFCSQLNVLDGHTWSKTNNALPLNYQGYRDSAVVWHGEMYIFGGYSDTKLIYKYNGDTWTNVGSSPYSLPMVVLEYNDKIYVIGYSGESKVLSVWDGVTWTTLTRETYPFTGCGACVYSDEIYLVGGSNSNVSLKFLRYIGKTYSEFKGYVVDELISKYPDDDILNGYLYKKVSELEVFEVNGKIIPSSDLYNITLNIGAGNSLVLVNIYGSASSSYAQQVIYGIYGGYGGKIFFSPDTPSYQFSVKDNGDGTVSIGNSLYPFNSGVTYTWSALVRKKV